MAPINKDLNFNIRVNQATAQQANAAASTLIDRLKDLKAESQQLRVDSDQLSASWRAFAASADAHDALKDAKRELTLLEQELRKVQNATEDADRTFRDADGVSSYEARIRQASEEGGLYGDVGSRIRDIGGLAGAVGGTGIDRGFMIGGDILDAAEGMKRFSAELPALASRIQQNIGGLGAMAAAGGALTLVSYGVAKALENEEMAHQRALEAAQKYIDGLLTARNLLRESTAEQVEDTIGELRAQLRGLESDQDALRRWGGTIGLVIATIENGQTPSRNLMEQLNAIFTEMGIAPQGIDELKAAFETLQKRSSDLEGQITNTQAQIKTLTDGLDKLAKRAEGANRDFTQSAETRTKALEKETEGMDFTRQEAGNLADMGDVLGGVLDFVTQGAERVTEAVTDTGLAFDEAAVRALAFNDAQAKVDEDRTIKSQREQEDFERKRLQDLADFYTDQADLDMKYLDDRASLLDDIAGDLQDIDQDRLDAIKDYNQESRRLAQDHKDSILQIQRETDRDYDDAARARDTAGALAALRNGERRTEDEQDSYEKEQDRREEDLKDQVAQLKSERTEKLKAGQQALQDLEQQHRKEHAAKESAFRQQIQREDEQRQIAARRQQQDWEREDAARQAHYGVIETDARDHQTSLLNITQGGMTAVQSVMQTAWNAIISGLSSAAVGTSAMTTGGAQPRLPTEFAAGGTPPLFSRVTVGEARPETAVFASGRRQIVGAYGRETAMFTEPVRIYPSAEPGININLGGIRIQTGGSARAVAQKLSQADFNRYLTGAIEEYVGGSG